MDEAKQAFAEASGTIGSRFESQKTVDEARERKDREWKDAYARIGQEPPPKQDEPVDDGRTLYERLQINKQAKTEEWDNKMKLSNQYRGLDTEEMAFLADKAKERRAEEMKREAAENAEVAEYRERLAAKNAATMSATEPQPIASSSKPAPTERKPAMPVKVRKDVKSLMKGIVVKKKPKAPSGAAVQETGNSNHNAITGSQPDASTAKRKAEDGADAPEKKSKNVS